MAVAKPSQAESGARRSRCLLSLDGGGIRGISSIAILRELMRHVNNGRQASDLLQPWQVFDLIGGTSTGGIIAIMIGCLKMTLDECEEAYMTMAQEIFQPKRSRINPLRAVDYIQANERFDSKSMEKIIKNIISQRTGNPNHKLMNRAESQPACRVFVTSVKTINQELCLLRNYDNPHQPVPDAEEWELWEALRATSAANTYFQEHRKGQYRYVDGALKGNNPVYQVMMEADELWDRPDAVMVSIGTGEKTPAPIEGNIFKLASTLTKALINPGDTDIRFRRDYPILVDRDLAYRFSVPKLGHVKLHDFKSIPIVKKDTELFFRETSMTEYVQRCSDKVRAFSAKGGLGMRIIEPRRLANLTQEEKDCLRWLHTAAGDCESQRISIDKPVPGTCEWFLGDARFSDWLGFKDPSLLWVTANPGCGKSVLSSFLVDSLQQKIPDAITCFFFFKAGEQDRSQSCQALCALIHQLLTKAPKGIKYVLEMFSSQDPHLVMRNIEALWEVLKAIMQELVSRQVIFIVDALDECSEASRNRFIDILVSTFPHTDAGGALPGALKILTTSRPWPLIERRFKHLNAIRLRGEDESRISADIEKMVKYKVDELSLDGTLSPEARALVEDKLLSGADQTFLWVSLVFDKLLHLHSRTLKSIRKALESVPNQLDELFESALSQFPDRDASLKLLRAVVAAKSPLHLDGINIALNIDTDTETLASLREGLEPNMEFTTKQLGGFFIRIIDSKVHLVHQTAREFLLGNRANELIKLNTAPVDIDKGDAELAEACVRFLTLGEIPRHTSLPSKDDDLSDLRQKYLQKLPAWARWFFPYAAANWGATSGVEMTLSKHTDLKDLVALLCNPNETLLTSWWLFYTNENLNIGGTLFKQESPYLAHLTTFRGHLAITKKLVESKVSKITDKDNSGRDLLLNAASNEEWEHVAWLLESFPWAELQYGEALIESIWAKDVRIITSLIEAGTDLNKPYKHEGRDITPGQRAAQSPKRLELLLRYGMKVTEAEYETAVAYGATESLKVLLRYDTRPRTDVERTINSTFAQATEFGFLDCRDLMIDRGADISIAHDISVGLVATISRGDMASFHKLLEHGADPSNALKDAAASFNVEAVEILLRERPFSAEQVSDAFSHYFKTYVGRDLENHVIRVMERTLKSANPTRRLHNAFTIVPSFGGVGEERSHFFTLLLSSGGQISPEQFARVMSVAIAFDETFALFLLEKIRVLQTSSILSQADFLTAACLWGKKSVICEILSLGGVDVNKKDKLGMTPIFAAVASGNHEVASLLLKHGANVKETTVYQQIPFDDGDILHSALETIFGLVKDPECMTALSAIDLARTLQYQDVLGS